MGKLSAVSRGCKAVHSFLRHQAASRLLSTAPPHVMDYDVAFDRSLKQPSEFWAEVAQGIVWTKPWDKVMDASKSTHVQWFSGGELSVCYNACDRHVDEGKGSQTAVSWDSPVSNKKEKLTYKQLQDQVSHLAGVLSQMGVKKGDRVLIYMPMIPQAIVTMLATARLGAVHSLVFGGFAAKELAIRIRHATPRVLVTASHGIEPTRVVKYWDIVREALSLCPVKPSGCIMYQRPGMEEVQIEKGRDVFWEDALDKAKPHDCVPVDANDPLYILYTSGTTGEPKGIVRPSGGHAVTLNWTMQSVYGLRPGEAWWAASDLGWVVGHSYICYAPLLAGNPTLIYEGKPVGTPDAGQFLRVISENNVKGMFTAPTALRAIKSHDPTLREGSQYDFSCLKYLFVAGEHCDYETREWAEQVFKVPVLDNWWQTETGSAITASCIGMGNSVHPPRDAGGKPFPGYNVVVLNEAGQQAEAGELGRICCKLPLPPGFMNTLWNAEERFMETYFLSYPGYYDTMDAGMVDEQGYVYVMARDDDVINVAGHRMSTSALEEAVLECHDVIDCAVVGVPDKLKGEVPLALWIRHPESTSSTEAIQKSLVSVVRDSIGPVAAFRLSVEVHALPRTRSGKTARKSIADLARNKQIKIMGTIEDPSVYTEIMKVLKTVGYGLEAPDPIKP